MSISAPNGNRSQPDAPASLLRQGEVTYATSLKQPVSEDVFVSKGNSGVLLAKKDVSQRHVQKADRIVSGLPPELQKYFRDQGCQVKLAKTMGEIFPDTIGRFDETDPSQPEQRRCEEIRGCTAGITVGIPELIKPAGKDEFVPQTPEGRLLTVLRHELGHALHNTSHLLYKKDGGVNPDFYKAYTSDVAELSEEDREAFNYYIRPNPAGKTTEQGGREAFAEIFASLYGGGCKDPKDTQKAFPRTFAYMKQGLNALLQAEKTVEQPAE